jgi:hypothetical protein
MLRFATASKWIVAIVGLMAQSAAPAAAQTADQDFAARCAAPGVIVCRGWDDSDEFVRPVYPGDGLYPDGSGTIRGTRDTSVRASGSSALKFTIPSVSGQNSAGQWVQRLGATFGENTTFYVQFRYRVSPAMLSGRFGGNGWKVAIFHYAFNSCSDLEITTQNTYYRGFPQMYTNCGAFNMEKTVGGTLYVQQGADPIPNGGGWNCPYGNFSTTRCSFFQADRWHTLYYRVDVGTWGSPNSNIQAWIAYDGQPYQQFINAKNFTIYNSAPVFPGFDHISLLPYDTNKTSASNPEGYVWYDELIVSRQPIAVPGIGPSDATAPASPSGLVIR